MSPTFSSEWFWNIFDHPLQYELLSKDEWSILRYLFSSGRGKCLENKPTDRIYGYPEQLAGRVHDGDAQCRFQYGPFSVQCKKNEVTVTCSCSSRVTNTKCETLKCETLKCETLKCMIALFRMDTIIFALWSILYWNLVKKCPKIFIVILLNSKHLWNNIKKVNYFIPK